jgi:hypothetical protein
VSKSEEAKPDDGKIEKDEKSDQPENPASPSSAATSPPVITVAHDKERSKEDEQVNPPIAKTACQEPILRT